MDQQLQDLINELQNLVPALKGMSATGATAPNNGSDKVVRAIAQLTTAITANTKTKQQQEKQTKDFIKNVESATKAVEEQEKAVKKTTKTIEDLNDEILLEKKTREDANKAANEEVNQRLKNANVSDYVTKKFISLGGESVNAVQAMRGLNVAVQGTASTLGSAVKGLGSLSKTLGEGNTSFTSLNPIIDIVSSGLAGMASAIPFAGAAISAGIKAAAEGSKFVIDQLQKAAGTFNELASVGALTKDGMTGVQQGFLESGMSLDGFKRAITQNSGTLAAFAGTVGDGRKQFTKFVGSIIDSDAGKELRRIGLSADQIGETSAAYLEMQTKLGQSQNKSTGELKAGTMAYAKELDILKKLTGASAQELQKQQEAALGEGRFRASYDEMVANGQEKQAKAMLDFQSMVNKVSPEVAAGLRDVATGNVNSASAQALYNSTQGKGLEIMQQVQRGEIDQVEAFKLLQNSIKDSTGTMRQYAKAAGDGTGTFVNYSQSQNLANAKIVNGMVELTKEQQEQMKGGDKLTESTISAQQALEKSSREVQNFGFQVMPQAAKAVEVFSTSLSKFITFVGKATGMDLQSTGLTEKSSSGSNRPGAGKANDRAKNRRDAIRTAAQQRQDAAESLLLEEGDRETIKKNAPKNPALGEGPAFSQDKMEWVDKLQKPLDGMYQILLQFSQTGIPPYSGTTATTGGTGGGTPGTPGAAAPAIAGATPGAIPGPGDGLGKVSEQWESGGRGSGVVGWDKVGGTSYGKYQIASKVGSMDAFMKFAEKEGRKDVVDKLRAAGPAETGGTGGKMPEVWKQMAAAGELGDLEHKFIKSQSYDVGMGRISDPELKKKIESNKALQEMMWSTSVQHGGAGAAGILNKVYKKGMSEEDLVKATYAERGTRFGGSEESMRKSIQEIRFPKEQATILAMLGKQGVIGEQGTIAKSAETTAPTVAAADKGAVVPSGGPGAEYTHEEARQEAARLNTINLAKLQSGATTTVTPAGGMPVAGMPAGGMPVTGMPTQQPSLLGSLAGMLGLPTGGMGAPMMAGMAPLTGPTGMAPPTTGGDLSGQLDTFRTALSESANSIKSSMEGLSSKLADITGGTGGDQQEVVSMLGQVVTQLQTQNSNLVRILQSTTA